MSVNIYMFKVVALLGITKYIKSPHDNELLITIGEIKKDKNNRYVNMLCFITLQPPHIVTIYYT